MMFIVPYFIEEKKEAVVDGGSMDEEYEQWLASQIQNSEYSEPPVDELIEIINQVTIPEDDEGGEWIQYMDLQVLPLSLDQYWDAFLSDEAPYYIQAVMRDPEDIVLEISDWREPSEGFEIVNGRPVIQEKLLTRNLRVR